MGSCSAVGIDDDLSPGKAAIAVRAADKELARRIDVPHRVFRDPVLRQRFSDMRLNDLAHVLGGKALIEMLVRNDDLSDADRIAVLVLDGYLAFGVRSKPRLLTRTAHL